jgi:hypothetical protein
MRSSNYSGDSSQIPSSRPSSSSTSSQQRSSTRSTSPRNPRSNPHRALLRRNASNCPENLTDSQEHRWFKAADKAKRNAELLRQLPPFHSSNIDYGEPIFIHHLTPHSTIHSLLQQLREVNVYVIDSEGDPPTQFHPEPLPALIQIQAIHHETLSTILLIELQFLPYTSTPTFFNNSRYSIHLNFNIL